MGDPARADESKIVDLPWLASKDWTLTPGYLRIDAHAQLLVDNLLDYTHVAHLHKTTISGDPREATTPTKTERLNDGVRVGRWMIDFKPPPLFAKAGGFDGNVDRWQHATWRPPTIVYMDVGAAKTGTGAPEGDRSQGISIWSTHLVTPESDASCHYHFGFARNFQRDDAAHVEAALRRHGQHLPGRQGDAGGAAEERQSRRARRPDPHRRRRRATAGAADAGRAVPRRGAVMPRIPVPTLETMSPEQRRVHDSIVGLRGGHMPAPYRTALHSPELCDKWQQMGELLRYRTSLPKARLALRVTAIEWFLDEVPERIW